MMPLYQQRIDHLLGGVSQRPEVELNRYQLQESDNWLARLTLGLVKRPPLEYIGKLTSSLVGVSSAATFSIDRNDEERFRLVVQNGGVKVYDTLNGGAEVTVKDRREAGSTYFDAVSSRAFRAATVGDDTYIVNQGVTCGKGSKKSASQNPFALVTVEQADFSTNYSIVLFPTGDKFGENATPISTTTPEQSTAGARVEITTEAIAQSLLESSEAYQGSLWNVERISSTLLISRKDGADFFIDVHDGLGDNGLRLAKGDVESLEELTRARAPEGYKMLVAGDPSTDKDDYWVEYDTTGADPAGESTWGRWRETLAPNVIRNFDSGTLPHRLRWQGTELNDKYPISPLPPGFWVEEADGTADEGGFTTDESNNARNEANAGTTETHDEGFRRLIPGSDGTTPQRVTVRFTFENADAFDAGFLAFVEVNKIASGGASTNLETFGPTFVFGTGWTGVYTGGVIEYEADSQVWATTDKIELRLVYQNEATPSSSLDRATLGINGFTAGMTDPPVEAVVPGGIEITIPDATFRTGMEAIVKLDGGLDTFTYTVVAGDDYLDVAAGLQALINANASYTAAVSGSLITITETADATVDPNVSYARTAFATNTAVIDPRKFISIHEGFTALNIIANAFVGETIRNLSDGSEATITSNDTDGRFVCDGLTGGVDNTFQPGDIIEIVGTGDYFVLEPVLWEPREVGTEVSNPFPSFINAQIKDVFIFRNRLGFLTGENIVFSESGKLENFWRTTTTDLVDGDRIDIRSAQPNTADYQHALVWNRGLFIWSDIAQYEVSGEPVLAPATVRLDLISRFPNSRAVPPVVAGRRVYFAHQQEGHVGIREWIPPTDSEPRYQAPNVTIETPTYLPGKPVDMAADYAHGILAVLCSGDPDAVYLYSFGDDFDGRRIMSAWQRMTLPPGVTALQVDFIDGKMGLVYTYDQGVFLDEADFDQPGRSDSDVVVFLDRQVTGTDLVVAANGANTDVTLPYETDIDDSEGVTEFYDKTAGAKIAVVSRVDRDTFTITGSHAAADIVAGIAWTATAKLAPLYLRDREDGAETGGRAQIRYIEVQYNRTQDLKIKSTPVGRAAYTATVQETALTEGNQRLAIMARGEDVEIELISDDPGDARVSSVDYEMFFHNRARRV